MSASSTVLKNTALVAAGSLISGIGYATLVERNAFVVREMTMPVLTPGSSPLRVLHLSDFHMRPQQRRKQAWLRELARWEPDLVVNTGDNPSLDPQNATSAGFGYCVFGRVVSGMAAVDKIEKVHTVWFHGMPNVPEYPVRIKSAQLLP